MLMPGFACLIILHASLMPASWLMPAITRHHVMIMMADTRDLTLAACRWLRTSPVTSMR